MTRILKQVYVTLPSRKFSNNCRRNRSRNHSRSVVHGHVDYMGTTVGKPRVGDRLNSLTLVLALDRFKEGQWEKHGPVPR